MIKLIKRLYFLWKEQHAIKMFNRSVHREHQARFDAQVYRSRAAIAAMKRISL